MPVKTETMDAIISALSTGLNAANTAAGGYDSASKPNTTAIALGLAQTAHSAVDVSTKGLQSTSIAVGRAVPIAGGLLGALSLRSIDWGNPLSTADQAGAVNGASAVVGFAAYAVGAPAVASALGVVGVIAGGVQIVSLASEQRTAAAAQQGPNPNVQPLFNPALVNPKTLLPVRPDSANIPNQTAAETNRLARRELAANAAEQSALSAAVEVSENSKRTQAQALAAERAAADATAAAVVASFADIAFVKWNAEEGDTYHALQVTIKKIAAYAMPTRARGRFGLKFPANVDVYMVAA